MLLPREQSPWNCGYYLGAIALQAIKQSPAGRCDIHGLERRMSSLMMRQISPAQVVNAAAWLYLLDAIKLEDDGMVTICS